MKVILFLLALVGLSLSQSTVLRISWNRNPETDMSHYLLDRRTDAGTFSQVANVPHPASGTTVGPYVDTPTAPIAGHRYSYRVRAVDTGGLLSLYSDTVGVGIPLINASAVPSTLTGTTTIPLTGIFSDPLYPIGSAPQTDLTKLYSSMVNCTVVNTATDMVITLLATSGTGSFVARVTDPQGFFDQKTISFTINVNVAPNPPTGVVITN